MTIALNIQQSILFSSLPPYPISSYRDYNIPPHNKQIPENRTEKSKNIHPSILGLNYRPSKETHKTLERSSKDTRALPCFIMCYITYVETRFCL